MQATFFKALITVGLPIPEQQPTLSDPGKVWAVRMLDMMLMCLWSVAVMSIILWESADVGCINSLALISPVEIKCRRSTKTSVI